MIAHIRQTEDSRRLPRLRRAHRLVASTLLKTKTPLAAKGPAVTAWRAWLFAAWVVVATAVYAANMAGILSPS